MRIVLLGIFWITVAFILTSCGESQDRPEQVAKWDSAEWIWHPDVIPMAMNRFTYFKKTFNYNVSDNDIMAYFAADSTARLYVNDKIVRRKVTRYHPSKVRPEQITLSPYLKDGENEILILHHNWGDVKNFQRDEIRRGGVFFFVPKIPELGTNENWQTAEAKQFTHHEQQIIGVIGDLRIRFPLIIDGSKIDEELEWRSAIIINDGPWTFSHDLYPKGQREEYVGVKNIIAAGLINYPAEFSTLSEKLLSDVSFPSYMENAEYLPDQQLTEKFADLFSDQAVKLQLKAGETKYATFDLHMPVHGYPAFELETENAGIAVSFGYGELNVSLYDASHHVDADTGWIKTEGVVGKHYGDRYITSGNGTQSVEIPEERTARYMTMHITAPTNASIKIKKLGIVKSQYPVDWRGDFEANDTLLDQIITLSKIHAEVTMSDVYIDTPGREDGQWLEDIRLRALIAEGWIGDTDLRYLTLAHSQESSVDGKFLSFAPQSFIELVSWDWGMQWITMLHDHLMWFAMTNQDTARQLANYFAIALTNYVELLIAQVDDDGLFRTNNIFADIRVGEHASDPEDVSVIAHTWLIKRLGEAIEIADTYEIAGADIIGWIETRERMIDAFHSYLVIDGDVPYAADVLYASDGRLAGKSQAAQLSAIDAGLFAQDQAGRLMDNFFPAPVGRAPEGVTPWNNPTYLYRSLKVLTDNGLAIRAMAHLKWRMSPYLPGSPDNLTPKNLQGPYGGPLPEYFVRHEDIGLSTDAINTAQPQDPTGSHGWAAVGMVWLQDSVLGITWDGDGLGGNMLHISPDAHGLDHISGAAITPWGKVEVDWREEEGAFKISIPDNVKANIHLPGEIGCSSRPDNNSFCAGTGDQIIIEGGGEYLLN